MRIPRLAAFSLAVVAIVFSCAETDAMVGLRATPAGNGPRIKFDLLARPLPEIPIPNDVATRADPTSPTGKRINATVAAPTVLERTVRQRIDALDGWQTFGPLTMGFETPIDLNVFLERHRDLDIKNDAIFLINIDPRSKRYGTNIMLDLGRGSYPVTLERNDNYFLNDEHGDGSNMIFETHDEDKNNDGVLQPEEDIDHDEILDVPNTWTRDGHPYFDLIEFYEKHSNTLIMRPMIPMDQETLYAVVVTNRLVGAETGESVRSPFPYVNHAAQNDQVGALRDILPRYGLTVDDVAFTWAFTTQTTTREMEAIRTGMDGKGPFAWVAEKVPADMESLFDLLPPEATDELGRARSNLKILPISDLIRLVADPTVRREIVGDEEDFQSFVASYRFLSHIVIGKFKTPFFMAEPGGIWDLNYKTGEARWTAQDVYFTLFVPKECPPSEAGCAAGRVQPFPVVSVSHGYTSARVEAVGFAGHLAQFGFATIAIDAVGHGLNFATNPNDTIFIAINAVARANKLEPLVKAIFADRSRDLNHDGINDSGGDFWTADTFHTRDIVRQTIVDWMQMFKMLRTFDGKQRFAFDLDTSIAGNELAGDFDADGTPDVGGPKNQYYAMGGSLGGILSMIIPAVEPTIVAAAPVSGGGGLADIGIRSTQGGVVEAVFMELLGPLVATRLDPDGQTDLVFNALDVNDTAEDYYYADVARTQRRHCPRKNAGPGKCEGHAFARQVELQQGDRILVINRTNGKERYDVVDRTQFAGGIRIAIPSDKGDLLEVQVLRNGQVAQTLATFDFRNKSGVDDPTGTAPKKLFFSGLVYGQGSPLRALHRGFGLRRQNPEMRRFMSLAQLILEPGDPINYAPHYFLEPLPIREGNPANVLIIGTMGDTAVPVYTSVSQARAAGCLGYDHPDRRYGTSQNDVLIENHVVEAVEKLLYYKDDPRFVGKPWVDAGDAVLLDPDNLDEGAYDSDLPGCPPGNHCQSGGPVNRLYCGCHVPNLPVPLRATVDSRPRGGGYSSGRSALRIPGINRTGQHGFELPDPRKRFSIGEYMGRYIGRYFMTQGTRLPEEEMPYFPGCEDNKRYCHLCLEDGSCGFLPDH